MKKIIAGCLMLCLSVTSAGWAQISKGTKYWGGGVRFSGGSSQSKSDLTNFSQKIVRYSFKPSLQFGMFYKNNRMFGASALTIFSRYTYKNNNNPKLFEDVTQIGLTPFARQYKFLGKKWILFLQESVPLGYSFYKNHMGDDVFKDHGFSAGVSVVPGISFKISDRFLIESDIHLFSLALGYSEGPFTKDFFFASGLTTGIESGFGVRASWLLPVKGK